MTPIAPAAPEGPAGAMELTEPITAGPARALAGLLGVPLPDLEGGEALPLLWHWVYLLDRPPQSELGADGHRAAGGIPLPPGPGRRRMFGGGRVRRLGPLRTGAAATRRTWVAGSADKHGGSGPLSLVTVRSEIRQDGRLALVEEQDIIYRDAAGAGDRGQAGPGAGPPRPAAAEPDAGDGRNPAPPALWPVPVDPVLLFRFSALTYNGHRIHYDRDFARDVEGYPGLVVHGPLQAILMTELARRSAPLPPKCEFGYRLVAPLIEGQGLTVSARRRDAAIETMVADATGRRTAAGVVSPAG